jgi:hypothetical protein
MIKAHCISQEYWYMRKQRCECGGEFERWMKTIEKREGTYVDVHKTRCKRCDKSKDFAFDISSFFGRFISHSYLAEVEDLLKREYNENEVMMKLATPMEATLLYLTQLREASDTIALQYIADAVRSQFEENNE